MKRLLILALATVGIVGCSSHRTGTSSTPTVDGTGNIRSAQAVSCDSLVGKPGATWEPIVSGPGCTIGDTVLLSANFDCKDGSKLYQFGDSPWYYGRNTDPLKKSTTDISTSAGPYATEYASCVK